MRHPMMIRFRSGQQGMVLIAAALTLILLIGILGLAFDLARLYVARNELQAFVDAASIAATMKLDGTSNGVTHARDVANSYPNKWNFSAATVQNITVGFSEDAAGPYVTNPTEVDELEFVQVSAQTPVVLYFLPGFSTLTPPSPPPALLLYGIARIRTLQATATSGQFLVSSFRNGLLPYSPEAHNPADPEFGWTRNRMYTLRWPPPGQRDRKNNWCDGDEEAVVNGVVGYASQNPAAERGFIDIGEDPGGGGSSYIRQAIVNNVQSKPLAVGDVIIGAPGNRGTESDALRERFGQDSDTSSETYADYMAKINDATYIGARGSNRRFVIVPVNNPANDVVVGFAGFFIHDDVCSNGGDSLYGNGNSGGGGGNVETCCAEYVGPVVVGGGRGSGEGSKAVAIKLFK